MIAMKTKQQTACGAASAMAQGAIAGAIATVPMTAAMNALHSALPHKQQGALPPEQLTMQTAEETGIKERLDASERCVAVNLAHYAFGAGAGSLYGLAAQSCPDRPLLRGIGFGLGIWATCYLGWLPIAGFRANGWRETAERNAMMIGAHVVWGAAAGLLYSALRKATDGSGRHAERPATQATATNSTRRIGSD
jgi:putative membrane protein